MDSQTFERLTDEQLKVCKEVMFSKRAEYSGNADVLHNFRQAVTLLAMSPAEVAFCYDTKHISSIQKIVKELSQGRTPSEAIWREKITDYLNYGLLMHACVMEAISKEREEK